MPDERQLGQAIEVLERVADALRQRRIRNPGELLAAWMQRGLADLINSYDEAHGAGRITENVLAKALRDFETIGSGSTRRDAAPQEDERTRMARDRSRWYGLLTDLAEWPDGEVVAAARAVESAGGEVTLAAVKLRLGPPKLTDETDPVTAPSEQPARQQRAA